jgi:hypothetical protein
VYIECLSIQSTVSNLDCIHGRPDVPDNMIVVLRVRGRLSSFTNNMGPTETSLLRAALGGRHLVTVKESVRYSNVCALLGLNLEWIERVNALGYAVILAGKILCTSTICFTHPLLRRSRPVPNLTFLLCALEPSEIMMKHS